MADVISSLPEDILRHIFSFNTTKFAISTSVLSKRWRHVWCDIPSLSFVVNTLKVHPSNTNTLLLPTSINETLARYTAPAMKDFHLKIFIMKNIPDIDRWIDFAMSRKVENLSLDFWSCYDKYKFPDFFYTNSSVKQLTIEFHFDDIIPRCLVSWISLQKLSLRCCNLTDESMAKILSGCPVLESLTLYICNKLTILDLSESLRLRTLQVIRNFWVPGPTQIIAPHIHYLRLTNSDLPCTLVDVASLTEANLDICYLSINPDFKGDFLQDMVLKMIEKLQYAEKLTFGGNFLQILSLAELCGVRFPMFKVKFLTLETAIYRYVIPGIERLLQNSPDLKKLTIRARFNHMKGKYLDNYINQQGLNLNQCWRSKDGVFWNESCWDVELKHVVSLVELVLKNTKRLDKMALLLKECYLTFKFEELLPTLSHHINVFIALSTDTSDEDE